MNPLISTQLYICAQRSGCVCGSMNPGTITFVPKSTVARASSCNRRADPPTARILPSFIAIESTIGLSGSRVLIVWACTTISALLSMVRNTFHHEIWCAGRDSNPRLAVPKTAALSPELPAHFLSGGERGIRTLESSYPDYTLSRRARSTTPASLHRVKL